ncbi:fungal-specific transcription factor domain-containing protein [Bisporella sp. PMI_857]|nr:fungal-specific transcription factor domain-containing protein [Bisporella sp. PMI_857]
MSSINAVSNRAKKKSKLGCKTCKTRKIKCDEAAPVCRNCKVYYSNRVTTCEYVYIVPIPKSRRLASKEASSGSTACQASKSTSSSQPKGQKAQIHPPSTVVAAFQRHVGLLNLDPFNIHVKSDLPGADKLLHHYLTAVVRKCVPVGYTPATNPLAVAWWPLVQHDPFLHHVMLQIAAVNLEWAQQKPNHHNSSLYTTVSLELLKARLKDNTKATSDETIAAIACLAALENEKRNAIAVRMHVEGLKRMVRLRGGLSQVRASSPAAATVVFWFTFIITGEPQFPDEYENTLLDPTPLPDPLSTSHQLDFADFIEDRVTLNVLQEARQYMLDFEQNSRNSQSIRFAIPKAIAIHSKNSWLAQRLLHKPSPGTIIEPMAACCRYAACMFLFFLFEHHYPDPTLVLNSLLHKLKSSLDEILPCSGKEHTLVLWLLTVAGVTAEKLPAERDWAVGYLVESAAELGLRTWDDMRAVLAIVIWVDGIEESRFCRLWDDALSAARGTMVADPFCAIIEEIR